MVPFARGPPAVGTTMGPWSNVSHVVARIGQCPEGGDAQRAVFDGEATNPLCLTCGSQAGTAPVPD